MAKNNLIRVILFSAGAIGVIVIYTTITYISEIEEQIRLRDKLITNLQMTDSLYQATDKEYSRIISNYVKDCKITINGRPITTAELVAFSNQILEQNKAMKDSLTKFSESANSRIDRLTITIKSLSDSASIYKAIYKTSKNEYGVEYKVQANADGSFIILKNKMIRLDSALALYPYFKDKLSLDTVKNRWVIVLDRPPIHKK